MRFLRTQTWAQKGLENPAFRFFHERWGELLDYGVPISHRAPITTALQLLRELRDAERESRGSTYGKAALKAIEQEAFGIEVQPYPRVEGAVTADPVLQAIADDLIKQREVSTRHFIAGGAPPTVAESRSQIATQLVINRLEEGYLAGLIAHLRQHIFVDELGPGSIKRIDRLVTLLAAELLARGFAQSYLRTHTRMLELRQAEGLSEVERFNRFCERFNGVAEEVTVVFRVQGTAELWDCWPNELAPATEVGILPPGFEEDDQWNVFSLPAGGVRFIALRSHALDHHAASRLAYQQLQRLADLTFIQRAGKELVILAAATIRESGPRRAIVANEGTMQLQELPVPRSKRAKEKDRHAIADALKAPAVGDAAKRRLAGALRYYRISIGQAWLESSFTNLWTALEVLASTEYDENIIERVVRSVVPLLAARKMKEFTDDTLGYLLGIGAHKSQDFRGAVPEIFEGDIIVPHKLLGALADRANVTSVCRIYGEASPLICRRVTDFHESVTTGRQIVGRVYRSARRIEWQIRRLYRLRNSIVHGAAITLNGERLLTHLQSYVYESIVAEGRLLGGAAGINTIEDAVAAADGSFHLWMDQVRSLGEVKDLDPDSWLMIYTPAYSKLCN